MSLGSSSIDAEYVRIYEFCATHCPGCVPMPAKPDTKQPMYAHKAPADYDAQAAKIHADLTSDDPKVRRRASLEGKALNLLLEGVYVIDSDTPGACEWITMTLIPMFPGDFETCPMQKTRKGMHYFFRRPAVCDHYNSARALEVDGVPLEIDICTVTSTGTRGNINVAPSKNKEWVRSIHDHPLKELSGELYRYLDSIFIGKRANAVRPIRPGQPVQPIRQGQPVQPARRATLAVPELTGRQIFYTEMVLQHSRASIGGVLQPTVTREQVVWTGESTCRILTAGSPVGFRQCMANASHRADGDNAIGRLDDNGTFVYHCFSAGCKKSKRIGLDVAVADKGLADKLDALRLAAPPDWVRLLDRLTASLSGVRQRDLAFEALEIGGMTEERLLRCPDSGDLFAFREHMYQAVADTGPALQKEWLAQLEHNVTQFHHPLKRIVDGLKEVIRELHSVATNAKEGTPAEKAAGKAAKAEAGRLQARLASSKLEKASKALATAYGIVGSSAMSYVQRCISDEVTAARGLVFNEQPHLMGCPNGVLDLTTGELRDGQPSDRISMTVGYTMEVREPSAFFMAEVICKILPVPEERAAVRRIMAYWLYGEAPCKAFFVFTDDSGGYNGKSYFLGLLALAMGDYAHTSDARPILDGSKSSDASAHDEAGAALKSKRLHLMDEGLAGKKLNIKALTSGSTQKKTHRRCGARVGPGDTFRDTAKLVLACNFGDDPQCDGSDGGAQMTRLVYVHMRATFTDNVEKYALEHPAQEFVFQANQDVVSLDFRVDMINWLLPAYRELYGRSKSGVVTLDLDADIPESFKLVKQKRISAQAAPPVLVEEMKHYFEERYELADEASHSYEHFERGEFVLQSDFVETFGHMPAARACAAANKQDTYKQLTAAFQQMDAARFKPKFGNKGKSKVKNNCIVGYKRKRAEEDENLGLYPGP